MAVHESMRLCITNDKFYIEPLNVAAAISDVLVIDRVSQELSLQKIDEPIPTSAITKPIHGIFGIIRLLAGPYLIVITKKTHVGEVNGQSVWKVAGTEVLSYKRTTLHLTEQQMQDNKTYLSMVEYILGLNNFYFSTTYDVTHTMQRLFNTSPEFLQIPMHERADPRFVWNSHMLRELAQQPELSKFCLPILLGFIETKMCSVKGKTFQYIIISRRQCFRAGVRYYMRGLDSEGHSANFVETEQILEYEDSECSFVQTRGSVPLYWSQRPNLKYKPDPLINNSSNHIDGFQRHFAAQLYNYGDQCILNLLDQKGKELLLVNGFAQQVQATGNGKIRYEPFDFHHECRKLRWDRLSILIDRVQDSQVQYGYFMAKKEGSLSAQQTGVFRTNCIDCLDRTNVVQSLLARRSINAQFIRLGLLQQGERVEDQAEFEYMFKNIWADNADALARQYAGTGALKTDYTRTGRRTKWGLLKDGYNSAIRYYLNNFYDGFKQDAIDLFLGNHVVEETEGITKPSPLKVESDWKFYALPTIFIVAFSMCVISVLIPDERPGEQFMYVLFWGGASFMSLAAMYFYGNDFVNKPRLAQAKPKME